MICTEFHTTILHICKPMVVPAFFQAGSVMADSSAKKEVKQEAIRFLVKLLASYFYIQNANKDEFMN